MREAICKLKSMVKALSKQTSPYNDIQNPGWLSSIIVCITHRAGCCTEETGMVYGICGRENSILSEACSHCIVTSNSPMAARERTDSSWLSGWVARTSKELEIHFTAVQLGMFSEKTSAYDAICSTSSASLSRNAPFPQF